MADEGQFVCPCHSSAYDIRGDVVRPPAPRPLDLHPVRIENGLVKVDVSQTRKRSHFEASQVVYA
jgi:cytochrome b6-f complex iron-sulfur subunit